MASKNCRQFVKCPVLWRPRNGGLRGPCTHSRRGHRRICWLAFIRLCTVVSVVAVDIGSSRRRAAAAQPIINSERPATSVSRPRSTLATLLDRDPANNRLRNLKGLCQRYHLAQRLVTYRCADPLGTGGSAARHCRSAGGHGYVVRRSTMCCSWAGRFSWPSVRPKRRRT